jgi:hypothetical protein
MSPQASQKAASLGARLLALAHEQHEPFHLVLTRFAIERLLYRLGVSKARDVLVARGATALLGLQPALRRPIQTLELAAPADLETTVADGLLRGLLGMDTDDGVSIPRAAIRPSEAAAGKTRRLRAQLIVKIEKARIPLAVDVLFRAYGRAGPTETELPTLLELPAPRMRCHTPELVAAAALKRLVSQGIAAARLDDLYDLFHVTSSLHLDGPRSISALAALFNPLSLAWEDDREPLAFTSLFNADRTNTLRWNALLARIALPNPHPSLRSTLALLSRFFMPLISPFVMDYPFNQHWPPGGPWTS